MIDLPSISSINALAKQLIDINKIIMYFRDFKKILFKYNFN